MFTMFAATLVVMIALYKRHMIQIVRAFTVFIGICKVHQNYQWFQTMAFDLHCYASGRLLQKKTLLSFSTKPTYRTRDAYFSPYNRYEDILEPGVEADKLVTVRA